MISVIPTINNGRFRFDINSPFVQETVSPFLKKIKPVAEKALYALSIGFAFLALIKLRHAQLVGGIIYSALAEVCYLGLPTKEDPVPEVDNTKMDTQSEELKESVDIGKTARRLAAVIATTAFSVLLYKNGGE